MKSVGISAPSHESPREFVDNYNLAIAHDVIAVAFHEGFGSQRGGEAVAQLDIFGRVKILNAEELFNLRNDFITRRDGFLFLVDGVIGALF